MKIKFLNMDWYNYRLQKKDIGIELNIDYTNYGRIVYDVIDKSLFLLAVIQYGIMFDEVYDKD
jgi:hypothetical protein